MECRIESGLNPNVASVASLFISRWDVAVANKVQKRCAVSSASPSPNVLTREAYHEVLASPPLPTGLELGPRPQRLLWASAGAKDPKSSYVL